jgi:hypothetical protein
VVINGIGSSSENRKCRIDTRTEAMKGYLSSFGKTASRLAHNPLGVLALFLVLVYGFACLVVGFGADSLNGSAERLPLIWFLVLFPVMVLYVFYLLVTRHHHKLYAPSDYKDEKLFVTPLEPEVVNGRAKEEALEIAVSEQLPVSEAAPKESISQHSVDQIKISYVEAERLAFKALQEDLSYTIRQHVSVKGARYDHGFDGIAEVSQALHFFEVKYFQKPIFKPEFIEAALHRVAGVAFSPPVWDSGKYTNIVFHLVVVFGFPPGQLKDFENRLKREIHEELLEVQYHFYDMIALKRRFPANDVMWPVAQATDSG